MINRLREQEARLERKINPTRAARTRTLIQAGGLLEKSGLLQMFNITLGEDLQHDLPAREKALRLLGTLTQLVENYTLDNDANHEDQNPHLHTLGQVKISQK